MKPRALKFSVGAAACCVLVGLAPAARLRGAAPAEETTPPPIAETSAAPKDFSPTVRGKPALPKPPKRIKEIPYPVPVGDAVHALKIPELGLAGQLLSAMSAVEATRLDNEHVQMHDLKIDLYHPDGKEDFHIILPTSVLDLKTHIITSEQPVTVKTTDFELTGERMEFNTVDRTGKLLGRVAMHIHNLKQVAAVPAAAAPVLSK